MISPQEKGALEAGWYVDRKIYTCDDIVQKEKERIFYKTWQFACLTSEIKNPGDYFSLKIIDQPIIIIRGNDNKLRAFYNACTHRGAVLNNRPCGNEKVFQCIYHAWTFNLKGDLIGVPYEKAYGPDFDKKKLALVPVRVDTFHDLVFITLDPNAPSLIEYLGEVAPHLAKYVQGIEVIGRNSWTYEGNWKLWHENFRDNYHPAFTHRGFQDSIPHYAQRGGNWGFEPGHSMLQWIYGNHDGESFFRGMQRYSNIEFPKGDKVICEDPTPSEILAVFPNLDFQPGQQRDLGGGKMGTRDGFIQTAYPLGPNKARIDLVVYSSTDDDPETRQAALENKAGYIGSWGKTSADDTEAMARCQIGLHSLGTQFTPFARGIAPGKGGSTEEGIDGRDEYSLREYYRVYKQYLDREEPVAAAAE
jgi:phenylpropionate dioxygenase-like ring-hydroxylating dioxygenase large terminal subunit